MTTATPTSLSLVEKKRLWNEQKYDKFEEISQDKSLMFNYFMLNNDIFKMISNQDDLKFRAVQLKCQNEKSNVFFLSLAGIFLVDQVLMRFALPQFRINKFRFGVNFLKYAIGPCLIYTIYKQYFMDDYKYFFYKMQEKYSFGFQDYMKANRIFERALEVDRLEELLQKRDQFNWKNIPELPDSDAKNLQQLKPK